MRISGRYFLRCACTFPASLGCSGNTGSNSCTEDLAKKISLQPGTDNHVSSAKTVFSELGQPKAQCSIHHRIDSTFLLHFLAISLHLFLFLPEEKKQCLWKKKHRYYLQKHTCAHAMLNDHSMTKQHSWARTEPCNEAL